MTPRTLPRDPEAASDASLTDCPEARSLLFRLASGDAGAEVALAEHIEACRPCRREGREAKLLFNGLSAAGRKRLFIPPSAFAPLRAGIAAALLLGVAGAWFFFARWGLRSTTPESPATRAIVITGDSNGIVARSVDGTVVVLSPSPRPADDGATGSPSPERRPS